MLRLAYRADVWTSIRVSTLKIWLNLATLKPVLFIVGDLRSERSVLLDLNTMVPWAIKVW